MAYYLSPIETTLPDDSYYNTYANFQVGGNGNTSGDPTSDIGDIYGEENWQFYTWDSDTSSGFDTSTVSVAFDVKSDGSEALTVGENGPLTYQTDAIGPISSVVLEAAIQTTAETKWSDVSVEFLKNGSLVETDNAASGVDVNNIGGSATTADQTLTITPTATDCDEAIVLGTLRMQSPGISYPAGTAMYANIFVNGSDA